MSKVRWTPYQLRVIDALRDGQVLHFMTGFNARYFIGTVKPRPTHGTVRKLLDAQVLTLVKEDWRGSAWIWAGKEVRK